MVAENAIEMFVGGLLLDPNNQHPVVILKDEGGKRTLPIWIGVAEATSIASALKQLAMPRPLTHDLFMSLFQELGVRVERIVITDLRDATYYAELILAIGDQAIVIDSRPSDAIAIAVRASVPIFVSEKVLEAAKGARGPGDSAGPPSQQLTGEETQTEPEEGAPEEEDLSQVDKTKWKDILEDLDPDDFKFKM